MPSSFNNGCSISLVSYMQITDISLGNLHTPISKSDVYCLRPQDGLLLRNWVCYVANCHTDLPPSPAPVNNKDWKKCRLS